MKSVELFILHVIQIKSKYKIQQLKHRIIHKVFYLTRHCTVNSGIYR